jgi:phosphate/sulfate permease
VELVVGVVIGLGLSVAAGIWASRRGRSGVGWFFICMFLSPIVAFILLAVLKDLSAERFDVNHSDRAPDLQDEISDNARLTRSVTSAALVNGSIDPSDKDFESALEECLSDKRKGGVWAKAFAEAEGDEKRTQALYASRRAFELARERLQAETELLKRTEEGRAVLAQKFHDAKPKGHCPNCDALIPLDSAVCPGSRCGARFDSPNGWRVQAATRTP